MSGADPLADWRRELIAGVRARGVDRTSAEEIADELLDHVEARVAAGELPAGPSDGSVDEVLAGRPDLAEVAVAAEELGSDLRRARRARRWRDVLTIPSVLLLAFVGLTVWHVSWALRVDATDRFILRFVDRANGIDSVMPWFAYRGTAGTILAWSEIVFAIGATGLFFFARRPFRRIGLAMLVVWALAWFLAAGRQALREPGFFAPIAGLYAVAVLVLLVRWWIRLPEWAER